MTEPNHAQLQARASELMERSGALQQAGLARRAAALGRALTALADPDHPRGRAIRQQLPSSTGLSEQGVEWALRTSVAPMDEEALRHIAENIPAPGTRAVAARPGRLLSVILAGNVFSAVARGLGYPLLLGWPVLAKASSRDDGFAHALVGALREVDQEVGAALDVVTFPGGSESAERVLLEQADALSVYGSDTVVNELRGRAGATTTFIPHGHGLGVAFVQGDACHDDRIADALALDASAYDQRGCLSPHTVWVDGDAEGFARRLHAALRRAAQTLPRGPLPVQTGAAQLQWRGVAAARGLLLEGDGYAVSFEADASLRLSPGYRNVQVLQASSCAHFCRAIAPLGAHLKAVGVAGATPTNVAAQLPAGVAPRVCAIGTMQTPPMDAPADGQPWFHGLVQWVHVDPGDAT